MQVYSLVVMQMAKSFCIGLSSCFHKHENLKREKFEVCLPTAVEFNSELIIMLLIISGSFFLAQSNIMAAVSHSSMPTAFNTWNIIAIYFYIFTKIAAFVHGCCSTLKLIQWVFANNLLHRT
jgi:hypothetical protein